MTYCDCEPEHEAVWEGDEATLSETLIEAIATVEGVRPIELEPLADTIDAVALDTLFESSDAVRDPEQIFFFSVSGWNVFVSGDGRIQICDPAESSTPSPLFESAAVD
ncbi:HalOD1 output domain-containing protein [Haloarcula nitratireducens]|uniref:Halobacterial output domain-containing protein n=1 Tax=Haloarcula nitratireducens TaxID=2487749 RepID=A0AAW4PDA5_9EURY|nr:HalOD1 output domain-containing protein [Halomicroarcula nitratireducens]MBX0295717.1 hypothetical protein [Halomicroarcula nitratireducens]